MSTSTIKNPSMEDMVGEAIERGYKKSSHGTGREGTSKPLRPGRICREDVESGMARAEVELLPDLMEAAAHQESRYAVIYEADAFKMHQQRMVLHLREQLKDSGLQVHVVTRPYIRHIANSMTGPSRKVSVRVEVQVYLPNEFPSD
jgi:hypothetical protein